MRIAHYFHRFHAPDGGTHTAVVDMCTLLAQHGHRVDVLTLDDADVPATWQARGNPVVHRLPRSPLVPLNPMISRAGTRQCAEVLSGVDVLHIHTMWAASNLQAAAIARAAGRPYIVTPHGQLDDWSMAQKALKKRIFYLAFARRMLRNAAVVHCTATAELSQARRWFQPTRGGEASLPFDLSPYLTLPGPELARSAFSIEGDDPIVLCLGRIHYKKRPEVLIEAISALHARGVPARLLIAGVGDEAYLASLRKLAERTGKPEHTRFLGPVHGELKVSLYQLADVFALPTSQENFGLVFPEALACETPVVLTRGVDIWENLVASGGAVVAEPTKQEFADAIEGLLKDRDRLRQMGERGREWVLNELAPEQILSQLLAIYSVAAAGRPA